MSRVALIKNGVVEEIIIADSGWEKLFGNGVIAPDDSMVGDEVIDGVFTRKVASPTIEYLYRYAGAMRFVKETGGVPVFGFVVKSSREDRSLIYEAEASAKADTSFTTTWIAKDGTSHELGAEMVITIATTVRAHVASCFSTYTTVAAEIAAGTITTTEQIDAAAWPANE
ncbi:DUF4376 domain-containing protein [Xanthobacter sp. ZOL 2024]